MTTNPPFQTNTSQEGSSTSYVEMTGSASSNPSTALTSQEVLLLKQLLARHQKDVPFGAANRDEKDLQTVNTASSVDSDYEEFTESTHAWAVFADDPRKRATTMDRLVGTLIITFQVFTYWLFAQEAIEDYAAGEVEVRTSHANCMAYDEEPQDNFTCEAEFTNDFDAFVAFFMLGIFLSGDFLQAGRVIQKAPTWTTLAFAVLAGVEVLAAYVAACVAVSYNLFIGEVTDAVEVGVGLLFIRELSQRAYSGIRNGKVKQYKTFFSVLGVLVVVGMISDPLCEFLFAVKE